MEHSIHGAVASTRRMRRQQQRAAKLAALLLLPSLPDIAFAQASKCVSLQGSKSCPAFQSASVSTSSQELLNHYDFLKFVSDAKSFDDQMDSFIKTAYIQQQFQNRFGCNDVDLRNSSSMYARWTTTVICNVMVQMSHQPCSLSDDATRPICADTCAEYAQSEAWITANSNLCKSPNKNINDLIRADFTTCGLPDRSLSGRCISGVENESNNCGFGANTIGLCTYCGAGGINSTDTCCYASKAESRCEGVKLPKVTPTVTFLTQTPSATSSSTAGAAPTHEGDDAKTGGSGKLSGGAIAGIVIGAIAGVALLAFLLFFCLRTSRNRKGSQRGSVFNQPAPSRKAAPPMQQQTPAPQGYEVLPGGRIARMSALEGHSGQSPAANRASRSNSAYTGSRKKEGSDDSSSDEYGDAQEYEHHSALRPPPTTSRRLGSLSSASALHSDGQLSPVTSGGFSSPQQMTSQQSEQLPFFKDYYSQDDIHPSDRVSVLWAYQPRAGDEFMLERGDMLKVVGIWDDGWATGIMLDERAEDYEARRQAQRDSGVSSSSQGPSASDGPRSEMKAFPLVCVCVPQHWKKIIEGDGSTESGTAVAHAPSRVP